MASNTLILMNSINKMESFVSNLNNETENNMLSKPNEGVIEDTPATDEATFSSQRELIKLPVLSGIFF